VLLEEIGKDKMPENIANEDILERIGGRRTLLNNIPSRKVNLIDNILSKIVFYIISLKDR
jgi:hypothetical protein